MTQQRRITADELLDLADKVTAMASQAQRCSQGTVLVKLNAALPLIIEATMSAALNEAQDRRRLASQSESTPVGEK